MANTLLTISMITNEAAMVLGNNIVLAKCVNRDYDSDFGVVGAKIGQTINIRRPVRPLTRTGPVVDIQSAVETYSPLVFQDPIGVDYAFTSYEMTFSIDDFSNRFIKPAMVAIANQVDKIGFELMTKVYNLVGVPGTPLTTTTARDAVLQAAAKLYENLAPVDDGNLHFINGSQFNAVLAASNAALFNPQKEISDIYVKGFQGDFGGFRHYMDQLVAGHQNGTYAGTPRVNGANQTGATLVTDGWTPTTTSLNVGDVFTIANVFMVNGQTRQNTGLLQQFVVTEKTVTDGGGASTISISPAIITSGNFQNVTASPADDALITVAGASQDFYNQSLGFHRDAFMLANKELVLPVGVERAMYGKDPMSNVGIRVVQQYDVRNDQFITRFDTAIAWATLYEQLAVRLATN
jgi:hypothetical protein